MGERLSRLNTWVEQQLVALNIPLEDPVNLIPVSGDASFRRYFRAADAARSYIAVDAPPDKENSEPFVRIARQWFDQGVRVPQVLVADLEQGYMLLEDFGDRQLLSELPGMSDPYAQSMDSLIQIQRMKPEGLPPYDAAVLQREMDLFAQWFLGEMLGLDQNSSQHAIFELLPGCYDRLIESAERQTQVCVHRDFHSRNLMPLDDGGLGVIDFQDALIGPVTYDLVSLLRDSYVDWPDAQVYAWVARYQTLASDVGLPVPEREQFQKDFDLMGMQRQLKVVGIFSRLWLRDGKAGYLKDIPRTFYYLLNASRKYSEFAGFAAALDLLIPLMEAHPLLGDSMSGYRVAV